MPLKPGEKRTRAYSRAEIEHIAKHLLKCADDLKGFVAGIEHFDGELMVDNRARGLMEAIDLLTGWTDKLRTAYKSVELRDGVSPDPARTEPAKRPKRKAV
jgi:hypothetical protein